MRARCFYLAENRMPLYYEFKLITLILLQNNTLRIPSKLYINLVRPFLQPREPAIDEWLAGSYLNMLTAITNGLQYAVTNGPVFLSVFSTALHNASEAARQNAKDAHQAAHVRSQSHAALNHIKSH
jgi:hypothetical protein